MARNVSLCAIIILIVAISTSSCRDDTPEDMIQFTGESVTWPDQARSLPIEEIYRQYKYQLAGPGPWASPLSQNLGENGPESFELLLSDIEQGDRIILRGYHAALMQIHMFSEVNFCPPSENYSRLVSAGEKAVRESRLWRLRSDTESRIEGICRIEKRL